MGAVFGGPAIPDALFLIATGSVGLTFAHLLWHQTTAPPTADRGAAVDVAMLLWGVLWLCLARDAKRFDFFIGLPLAYFTARLLEAITTRVVKGLLNPKWTTDALRATLKGQPLRGIVTGILMCGVCLWSPFPGEGGHLLRSVAAGRHMRGPDPGEGPLLDAYTWIRANLPAESVVAAEWSYGTHLNVFGGVKTVVDPDHYLPYWIALYHQHVIHAKTEREALVFLLTHEATHLLVTPEKHPPETLFGRGVLSSAFRPRYPAVDFQAAPVRVYELAYPAGLEKRPEYLYRAPGVPLGPGSRPDPRWGAAAAQTPRGGISAPPSDAGVPPRSTRREPPRSPDLSETLETFQASPFYRTIVENNLFAPLGTAPPPETRHFRLIGTTTREPPDATQEVAAIVEHLHSGQTLTLRIGDQIGDETVVAIHRKQLTLERDGETVVLTLPSEFLLGTQEPADVR